jgi:flagellar biosynthesis regulator FlbT
MLKIDKDVRHAVTTLEVTTARNGFTVILINLNAIKHKCVEHMKCIIQIMFCSYNNQNVINRCILLDRHIAREM